MLELKERERRDVVQLPPGDLEGPIERRNQSVGGGAVVMKEMVPVRGFLLLAVGNRRQSRQSHHLHQLVLPLQSRQNRLQNRCRGRRSRPHRGSAFGSLVACRPKALIRSMVLLSN